MTAPFTKRSPAPIVDPVVRLIDASVAVGVSLCTLKRLAEREEIKIIILSPRRLGIRASELNRFLETREARA
jgi:hypothetical protein